MANAQINYDGITDAANKLKQGQTDLNTAITSLNQQIAGILADNFATDTASGKFGSSMDEFTKGAQNMLEGLNGMASFLTNVVTTYTDADSQLASHAS